MKITNLDRRCVLSAAAGMVAGSPVTARSEGWMPSPTTLNALDKRGVTWNYREERVGSVTLPELLRTNAGDRVNSRLEWERVRRPELLELFRAHVYGREPRGIEPVRGTLEIDRPALDGKARRRTFRVQAGGHSFPFHLFTPAGQDNEASPCLLLINNRPEASADPERRSIDGFWPVEEIIAAGFATAVFRTWDVDPDDPKEESRRLGIRGRWPGGGSTPGSPDAWGTLSAWAWGASRVMDLLSRDPAIRRDQIGLVGHSRGGKTSLWAGALDQRFALVVANGSGCGGAALSRRHFGETVADINRGFPHWFCPRFREYDGREAGLPVDQHQLIALMAPRPVYISSADEDLWADPRGEWLGLAEASPAWGLYGKPGFRPSTMPQLDQPVRSSARGPLAYHIRRGIHNLTAYEWRRILEFAGQLWLGGRSVGTENLHRMARRVT